MVLMVCLYIHAETDFCKFTELHMHKYLSELSQYLGKLRNFINSVKLLYSIIQKF